MNAPILFGRLCADRVFFAEQRLRESLVCEGRVRAYLGFVGVVCIIRFGRGVAGVVSATRRFVCVARVLRCLIGLATRACVGVWIGFAARRCLLSSGVTLHHWFGTSASVFWSVCVSEVV